MSKFTKEYLNKLATGLYQEAENLANNIDQDGETATLTVNVDEDYYEFKVEASMTNFKEDRDENSSSYNSKVFCTEIPVVKSKKLRDFLLEKVYCEIIYQD